MKDIESDELLWRLSELEQDETGQTVGRDVLDDYRNGRLGPMETEAIERLLARSAAARRGLAESADVHLEKPPPEVRARVLDEFRQSRKARRSPTRWWIAAAAASIAAVGLWTTLDNPVSPDLSEVPEYAVTIRGDQAVRSGGEDPPSAAASARTSESMIEIVLATTGEAVPGIEYGLYHRVDDKLRRLPTGTEIHLETGSGVAVFEAPAESLVGPAPGVYTLWAVAAEKDDLVSSLRTEPGKTPEELLEARTGGHAYPIEITLEGEHPRG